MNSEGSGLRLARGVQQVVGDIIRKAVPGLGAGAGRLGGRVQGVGEAALWNTEGCSWRSGGGVDQGQGSSDEVTSDVR